MDITTVEELETLYGEASERASLKELTRFDKHCRDIIALAPFVIIGSSRPDGSQDVSPRGESPGFIKVMDETTLALPDRPGNRRIDTLRNIIANPNVGLIFMIPGFNDTLRITGTARITTDPDVCNQFIELGKAPKTVMLISLKTAFLHCAKALMRSALWDPEARVERTTLPTFNEMLLDHTGGNTPLESEEDMLQRYNKELF